MRKQDKDKLRSLSLAELTNKVNELKREIGEQQVKKISGEVKNVHVITALRRKLALMLTFLREKQLFKE